MTKVSNAASFAHGAIAAGVLGLSMVAFVPSVQAATATGSCTGSWGGPDGEQESVTYTLTQDGGVPIGVVCRSGGSDASPTIPGDERLFPDLDWGVGENGWTLGNKFEFADDVWSDIDQGDHNVAFDIAPDPGNQGSENFGLWSVLKELPYRDVLLVLKQGNSFGAFLLDPEKEFRGTWETSGPSGSSFGLSNVALWYRSDSVCPNALAAAEAQGGDVNEVFADVRFTSFTTECEGLDDRSGNDLPPTGVIPLPAAGWLLLGGLGALGLLRRRKTA